MGEEFILYDKKHRHVPLRYWAKHGFREGDVFVLSFHFRRNSLQLTIYHNDNEADVLWMDDVGNTMVPAFSLSSKDDELEILGIITSCESPNQDELYDLYEYSGSVL